MFTRTRFYTQTLLQTNTFTQSFYTHFYTQTLSHTTTSTLEPCTRTLLRSKALPPDQPNSQKKTQFLTLKPYFVRKGCRRKNQTRKKTSVSDTRTSFHAKRLSLDQPNSQKNNRFWHSNIISCERVVAVTSKSQFYLGFWQSNLISCEKVAISRCLVRTARMLKREKKKKDRDRDREQAGTIERER